MRLEESGLRAELTLDARQSACLEAKELGEEVTDTPEMIFGKWIKIKSRGSKLLSYRTRIRNKLGFYSKEDT